MLVGTPSPRNRAFSAIACRNTNFTIYTNWCYNRLMKRATMTLPDDLAEAVDNYLRAQEAPPTLTTVVQTALREYLRERGFLQVRRHLKIRPAKRGSGRSDVSENHDLFLAGMKK
jgi:hypothetical protein